MFPCPQTCSRRLLLRCHLSHVLLLDWQVECEGCEATLQQELVASPPFRQLIEDRVARVCAPQCALTDATKVQPGPKVVPLLDPSPPLYVFVLILVLLLLLWRRLKIESSELREGR